jgi:anti-sigma-K factor RskA
VNAHVFDELPLLLTGEADRSTVAAVAVHLRECEDCRNELIAAITAHAALMSAARYVPELAAPRRVTHDRFDLDDRSGDPDLFEVSDSDSPEPPDLSAVFAQIRAEANAAGNSAVEVDDDTDDGSPPPAIKHRQQRERRQSRSKPGVSRPRVWLAAAAAAVVLGLGAGVTYAVESGPSTPTTRALSLQAFDQGVTNGSARLIGNNELSLDASTLPVLSTGRYYEVWLTNGSRTSMAPVGVLDADRKATITVPASEMSTYAAIEVSVQETSGVGSYSGHSVLRATYA